ncbi:AAA family ATPase [Pyxidicoccus parkwayensis]|uniref:histidine kinase n=1 Tax=Pyxidicoccus parkwayensis TaxID=2813578 RepID=A0ABX7NKX0_9BACT|nr:ATP-binding sensor histidine kinase [Pyxidicoccus parkwaysis]QSQ19086.1 AAA family ATPase [Pyxidicoccus parkwaysis]
MRIPGYMLVRELHQSPRTRVHRAVRERDGLPVVLKTLQPRYHGPQELAGLQREYYLLERLKLPGVILTYGLERWEDQLALVLEDCGGEALSLQCGQAPVSLETFFKVALGITRPLIELHRHVIHKNLNPRNILWNARTEEVRLIDFGIASEISHEHQVLQAPRMLEGSLPYLSPEQTGRMSRNLDCRSDLYSLGITFYELLTGQRPFTAADPMQWIHCHIARLPPPPRQLQPALPEMLSQLVLRLLAKDPEDRYQSAHGLWRDLEECQRQWHARGDISRFSLSRHDTLARFQIPQRLYGRGAEVRALLDAFEETANGGVRMVLVTGNAGAGKSALVGEVHKPVVQRRGFFAEGKFEQFQRHVPYAAFAQALQGLAAELLSEPEERLAHWKRELLQALGPNGQLVIQLVPQLEHILGAQPPVVPLNATEEQNRALVTFHNLIEVLARKSHPLVLFLDDLQWSDAPTLTLLRSLLASRDIESLLLVGAWRDNEIQPGHPVLLALEELEKAFQLQRVQLSPLTPDTVNQLISDTLHTPLEATLPLALLVHRQTEGNPFFVNELLKDLHREGLIHFSHGDECWKWELERISQVQVSDNVVEFMLGRLQQLPAETQELLKLAACIGNQFELRTLASVSGRTPAAAAGGLWEALREGIVMPLDASYRLLHMGDKALGAEGADVRVRYQFQHDRVQQAAYSLIPPEERKATHLHLGRQMLQEASPAEREERLLPIVQQLNEGRELIDAPAERLELAQLNLAAARRARAAAAYRPAFQHLAVAVQVLPENAWAQHFELTFEVYKSYAACAYLCGELAAAESTCGLLLERAATRLRKAEVLAMQLAQYNFCDRMDESIDAGLRGLRLLGIRMSPRPSMASVLKGVLTARLSLGRRSVAGLAHQPPIVDPEVRLQMRLLADLMSPAYLTGNDALFASAILRHASLALRSGHCDESALAYIDYGVLLAGMGDLRRAHEFGRLALELIEAGDLQEWRCRALTLYALFCHSWNGHWSELNSLFKRAITAGSQSGDLFYAAFACSFVNLFDPGVELQAALDEQHNYLALIEQSRYQNARHAAQLNRQLWLALRGETASPLTLDDATFTEAAALQHMRQVRYLSGVAILHLHKLKLSVLHDAPEQGWEELHRADEYIQALAGAPYMVEFCLHGFLTCVALANRGGRQGRRARRRLGRFHAQMRRWAAHCPENFRQYALLMEAERARLDGRTLEANSRYQEAIAAAREGGFLRHQALVCERAARHYLAQGLAAEGRAAMRDAHRAYAGWGALAKVRALEQRHPELREREEPSRAGAQGLVPSSSVGPDGLVLDIDTIFKAHQTISGEVVLERLLTRLLHIVTENAGADTCQLVLEDDATQALRVQASLSPSGLRVLQDQPLEACDWVPISLIRYVARSQTSVVLGDASRAEEIQRDSYFQTHRPRSVLALPIVNQGRSQGVLYLENHLTTDAFTPARIEVLQILSTQAAISIHNARLYADLRNTSERLQASNQQLEEYSHTLAQRVEERTHQLRATNEELRGRNEELDLALQQLRTTQRQLITQEKLASLGSLTAGIAHELRNPLNFVTNFAQTSTELTEELAEGLQQHPQGLPPEVSRELKDTLGMLRQNLVRISDHGRRASEIIGAMMLHARQAPKTWETADLNATVADSLNLARHAGRAKDSTLDVRFETEYGDGVGALVLLVQDMKRVFINLVNNAFYAMHERRQREGAAYQPVLKVVTGGDAAFAEVRLRDNGTGIPRELMDKVLIPFFTTKPRGEGTGLGLSICHDIVVQLHGGKLEVESEPGEYTEIRIRLPRRAATPPPPNEGASLLVPE